MLGKGKLYTTVPIPLHSSDPVLACRPLPPQDSSFPPCSQALLVTSPCNQALTPGQCLPAPHLILSLSISGTKISLTPTTVHSLHSQSHHSGSDYESPRACQLLSLQLKPLSAPLLSQPPTAGLIPLCLGWLSTAYRITPTALQRQGQQSSGFPHCLSTHSALPLQLLE